MTPRQRVAAAMAHSQPDYTPCDYFATPEIHRALLDYFGIIDDDGGQVAMGGGSAGLGVHAVQERLGSDIRYINPPYIGPPLATFDDGSAMNIWGIRRRPMPNQYGQYAEPVGTPYAHWTTIEEAERFPWPDPDWFDYEALPAICARYPDLALVSGDFHVQDFINGISYGRGVERTLMDIATEDPVFLHLVEKRQGFYLRYIERILDAAGGRIDLVLCGDDFGSQRGPLISPRSFDRVFARKKKEMFDLVHSYGAKVTHHSGMNPYELKGEFGGRIVLHGGVDVQGWLQRAAPAEIEREIDRLMDEVGSGGGYILSPCHHIQPDTPLENVLALYRPIAKRRGKEIVGR